MYTRDGSWRQRNIMERRSDSDFLGFDARCHLSQHLGRRNVFLFEAVMGFRENVYRRIAVNIIIYLLIGVVALLLTALWSSYYEG